MTPEIGFVFGLAVVAVILFVMERYPIDQVAVAIPVVLLLGGIISPAEAVSGLSHTGTITVAGMMVLSLGLLKTGAIATIARWAQEAPISSPHLRLLVLCLVVAVVSPFLNNTAVVAAFLPIFLSIAQRDERPASLYLIPLSYSAILAGTVTIIGTSTNLVVYGMVEARGFEDLSIFSIAPLGIIYSLVGLTYVFTVAQRLLPRRPSETDLSLKYDVRSFVSELEVTEESDVVGESPNELEWERRHDVLILGVQRGDRATWGRWSAPRLRPGDVLIVEGDADHLLEVAESRKLASPADRRVEGLKIDSEDGRLVELLIGRDSFLLGRTLREVDFHRRFNATVIAMARQGKTLRDRLGDVRLDVGDLILVHGPTEALGTLADVSGLIPLGEVESRGIARPKALVSVAILVGVVVSASVGIVSILTAVLVGVALLLFTGCVRLSEVYDELDWMVVFLLAGLIPLGIAMDNSGAAEWLGHRIAEIVGSAGPMVVVLALYLTASLLTEIMANVAAAVVLTPIALLMADQLEMNPYALIVTVMFAASASFMTPMGYQTNTLVYGPGGYRFRDFIKVGLPLNLLLALVAAVMIPILWPS